MRPNFSTYESTISTLISKNNGVAGPLTRTIDTIRSQANVDQGALMFQVSFYTHKVAF